MPPERMIITGVILAAMIAVALVALPAMGIAIPAFVIQIGWILVIAFIAVAALKFLLGMRSSS